MSKKITPELLRSIGFEPVDKDTVTRKYELRTKWQTVTLYCYEPANAWKMAGIKHANAWTLAGIKHKSDRATVDDAQSLVDLAKAFGADEITYERLKGLLTD